MNRNLLLTLGLLTTAALFLPSVLEAQSRRASRTKCANHLRQIGLATVQYGDDKRYLPHVGPTRTLDGDVTSNHSAVKLRALIYYGYHDNPEGFICPSSDDISPKVTEREVRENMRKWQWGRGTNPNPRTKPWNDTASDPKGDASHEFSYGLTRRGYNRNVSSVKRIAADRAVRDGVSTGALAGNHDEGWNVVSADCSVDWTVHSAESAGRLISTERGGGFLAIKDQRDGSKFKPLSRAAPGPTTFSGYYKDDQGALLKIGPSEWSMRSETWGVRGSLVVEGETYGLVGRSGGKGIAGSVDSPAGLATFAARPGKDTLSFEINGETHQFKRTKAPLPPLDRRLKNMVATGFVISLKTRNLEAARAYLTPKARAKTSAEELKKLSDEVAAQEDRQLGRYVRDVQGLVVRCKDGIARVDLGAEPDPKVAARSNESAAIGALKTISVAQTLFREGDKDGNGVLDYAGSLEALGKTQLIDKVLARGEKQGYRFVVCHGSKAPEFIWMAVASPKDGKGRHFAVNQAGVIYQRSTPFELDSVGCEIKGGQPVGR
jgi:hypothetical protein